MYVINQQDTSITAKSYTRNSIQARVSRLVAEKASCQSCGRLDHNPRASPNELQEWQVLILDCPKLSLSAHKLDRIESILAIPVKALHRKILRFSPS